MFLHVRISFTITSLPPSFLDVIASACPRCISYSPVISEGPLCEPTSRVFPARDHSPAILDARTGKSRAKYPRNTMSSPCYINVDRTSTYTKLPTQHILIVVHNCIYRRHLLLVHSLWFRHYVTENKLSQGTELHIILHTHNDILSLSHTHTHTHTHIYKPTYTHT